MSYIVDDSQPSSPDPLSTTTPQPDAPRTRSRKNERTRKPEMVRRRRSQVSPSKQTFELQVDHGLSPHKIRVTVEAENETAEALADKRYSKAARIHETTKTIVVPLKGLDDSESMETDGRGRGRRRPMGNNTPLKKRPGTPSRGRRKSAGATRRDPLASNEETDLLPGDESQGNRKSLCILGDPTPDDEAALLLSTRKDRHVTEKRNAKSTLLAASNYDSDAFSTKRSVTSAQSTLRSDIVLARFDPREATPEQTGWSSPSVVTKTSGRSMDKVRTRDDIEERRTERQRDEEDDDAGQQDYGDGDDHDNDTMSTSSDAGPDDTIMQSEGFSMISVDSVPSLQAHRSTTAIASTSGLSRHASSTREFEAAQTSILDDSFSEIPSHILEAASPVKKTQMSGPLKDRDTALMSPHPRITTLIQQAKKGGKSTTVSVEKETSMVDDSFSDIPTSILEAASPVKAHLAVHVNEAQGTEVVEMRDTTRLLTPEDTPSPQHTMLEEQNNAGQDTAELLEHADGTEAHESSVISRSYMPSSPPNIVAPPARYTYTAHLRQQRILNPTDTQTPIIKFTSPVPPPLRQEDGLLEGSSRNTSISPAMQAGRVLQQRIIIPTALRENAHILRSPFKSPLRPNPASIAAAARSSSSEKNTRFTEIYNARDSDTSVDNSNAKGWRSSRLAVENENSSPTQHIDDVLQSSAVSPEPNTAVDEMSWQAERTSNSDHREIEVADALLWADQAETKYEEHRIDDDGPQDDEDLNLLMETIDSSSPVQAPPEVHEWSSTAEKPRRSKLPSPWRTNSRRLVYSDELSQRVRETVETNYMPESTNAHQSELQKPDSESLATKQRQSTLTSDKRGLRKQPEPLDFDITSFSPVPGPIPQKAGFAPRPRSSMSGLGVASSSLPVSNINTIFSTESPRQEAPRSGAHIFQDAETSVVGDTIEKVVDTTIPQKQHFRPRIRVAEPTKASAPTRPQVHSGEISKSRAPSTAVVPSDSQKQRDETHADAEDQNAELQRTYPNAVHSHDLAQSRLQLGNGTRDSLESLFPKTIAFVKGLVGSTVPDEAAGSNEQAISSRPDILDTVSKDTSQRRSDFEASNVSDTAHLHIDPETHKDKSTPYRVQTRTREWTEGQAMLTPETATAPSLSPYKSANQAAKSKHDVRETDVTPSKVVTSSKERDQHATTSLAASSASRLSSTIWSKAHWKLLEHIKEQHEAAHQQEQARYTTTPVSSPSTSHLADPRIHSDGASNRKSAYRMVGRILTSGEHSRELQKWQIDVAEDFRRQVPGWTDTQVVGRVFTLCLGDELRATGVWPKC